MCHFSPPWLSILAINFYNVERYIPKSTVVLNNAADKGYVRGKAMYTLCRFPSDGLYVSDVLLVTELDQLNDNSTCSKDKQKTIDNRAMRAQDVHIPVACET